MSAVMVVPYGTGIGDFVNMRPLLGTVARRYPASSVHVLCPEPLAWLLPPDVIPVTDSPLLRIWQRPSEHSLAGRVAGALDVGAVGSALSPLPRARLAQALSWYLRKLGYDVVSLLEILASVDLSRRWTRLPDDPRTVHLVDFLAGALERRGIAVPADNRAPRLDTPIRSVRVTHDVLIQTASGSTLKELPREVWVGAAQQIIAQGRRCTVIRPPSRNGIPPTRPPSSVSHCTPADPRELSAEIASSRVLISPDTGALHLAAAMGVPWIGVFGSTDPDFLGPYDRSRGAIVRVDAGHEEVCRRCWAAQAFAKVRCPLYDSNCLSTISPHAIAAAVEEVAPRVVQDGLLARCD